MDVILEKCNIKFNVHLCFKKHQFEEKFSFLSSLR